MKTKHIILTLMQTLAEFSLNITELQPTDQEGLKALSFLLTEVQLTILGELEPEIAEEVRQLIALSILLTEAQLTIIGELEPEIAAEVRRLMAEEEVEVARESCVGGVQ